MLDIADRDIYVADASSPVTPRAIDEAHPAAATAAVALAQLHHHRLASDWESEMVECPLLASAGHSLSVRNVLLTLLRIAKGYAFR